MGFTYYDFFAGGGMAGIGLGPDWTCTFANDFDEIKASAYMGYHGGGALVVKDIRQVKFEELPGTVDLAWASPAIFEPAFARLVFGAPAAPSFKICS